MLNFKVENLEDVPETLQEHYEQQDDGSFVLSIEGEMPEDSKTAGLRDALGKERKLKKDAEKKLKAYGDHSPDSVFEMSDRLAEFEALKSKSEEQNEELWNAKKRPYEREIEKLKAENQAATEKANSLHESLLGSKRDKVLTELASGKIKSEFFKDLQLRAQVNLVYNDELNKFVDAEGNSVEDWFTNQIQATPSWELDSKGTGAKGGVKPNTVSNNPFLTGNLTEQMRLANTDPSLYEKYKAQAGK